MTFKSILFTAIALIMSTSANSALVSRLGGLAYYDTDLDVTWIADANLAASNTFGVSNIASFGSMDWHTANLWVDAMNADNGTGYLGYTDWRLPTTTVPDTACSDGSESGSGCLLSEMGHLNNSESVYWDDPTAPSNPFTNLQFNEYWSSTILISDTSRSWAYSFDLGGQGNFDQDFANNYAWVVRSGDVSNVPVPTAALLFGSGLLCFVGVMKRKAVTISSA